MMDGRGNAMFTSGIGGTTGSAWDSEVTRPYCFYSPSGKVQVRRKCLRNRGLLALLPLPPVRVGPARGGSV